MPAKSLQTDPELWRRLGDAVQHWVNTQLKDLAPLRELKSALAPDDAIALAQALEGIEWLVQEKRSLDIVARTCMAVEELNLRWLAERGVCALVRADEQFGGLAGDRDCAEKPPALQVSLHRVLGSHYLPLTDAENGVQFYALDGLVCGLPCDVAAYLHQQACIAIDYARIARNANCLWSLYNAHRQKDRSIADRARASGVTEFALAENTLLAISVLRHYPSVREYCPHYLQRVQLEETRHAVDWLRAEPKIGQYPDELEFCRQFLKSLVRPGGKLFAELYGSSDRAEGQLACEDCCDLEAVRATIAELSGQLTACALCHNPFIVLREWWSRMAVLSSADWAKPDVDFRVPHTTAAAMGISLLAQTMGIPLPSHLQMSGLGLPSATDVDRFQFFRDLVDACEGVLALPGKDVRLAVKRVYEREFTPGIIDEAPFLHRIADDGSLHWKEQADQPAAAPED